MGSFAVSQWLIVLLIGIIPITFFLKNLQKNLQDKSKNRFDPDSRYSRSEHAIRFIIFIFANGLITLIADKSYGGASAFFALISIGLLIFYFNIAVKRLHDLNMSGWYSLILIIPLANLVLLICLLFVKGSHYSSNPKHVVPENLRDDV